jgi:tetratricopeptide (TPR) repeat protein
VALRQNHLQEAQESFHRALACDAEDAAAYHGLGEIHALRGKHQSAMENYSKALKYYRDQEKKNQIMNQLFQEGQIGDS